jgi:hypothetical protein
MTMRKRNLTFFLAKKEGVKCVTRGLLRMPLDAMTVQNEEFVDKKRIYHRRRKCLSYKLCWLRLKREHEHKINNNM